MELASPARVVHGLEAIIDAAAGVLGEASLTATVGAMVRELSTIVPFTSLAVYEADHETRVLVPVYAYGRHVEETLADRPPFEASIAGSVVLSGELAHLGPGDTRLSLYQIPDTPDDGLEAIVVAPLVVGREVIGTLTVWREHESEEVRFAAADAQLIRRFATLAAFAYSNARQRDQLRTQALTDELTGLANRRHFHERLDAELARAQRDEQTVSLVLFDLDDFKAINDRHGHPAGDEALRSFAAVLREQTRASDLACRLGGEEFAAVLPGVTGGESAHYATRTLAAVRAGGLGPDRNLTASAGLASSAEGWATSADLYRVADDRLLRAKAGGKNRVSVPPMAVG